MRIMKCDLGMLPECFAHVMGSTQHPAGHRVDPGIRDGIPGYMCPCLARLDPELRDRRVLERVADRACLVRDPGGSYLGRQERDYLDRIFGRPSSSRTATKESWRPGSPRLMRVRLTDPARDTGSGICRRGVAGA